MRESSGMAFVEIRPRGPIDATVRPPASKSLTLRAMAAAAMASGHSVILGALDCGDTRRMEDALRLLGIGVRWDEGDLHIDGCSGVIAVSGAQLDLGDAGTPLRLLTALCATGRGRFALDGSPRMRRRPIQPLIEALRGLGVDARSLEGTACPPVEVIAAGFPGGRATMDGRVSSQFVSALLMATPGGAADLEVRVDGVLVSRPYVDLTLETMRQFGARAQQTGDASWRAQRAPLYQARRLGIEADASSASYFLAAAAITEGHVRVLGIPEGSKQGDLHMLSLLAAMGCRGSRRGDVIELEGGTLRGIEADLSGAPDIVPTLCAVALFASGPTALRGVAHLRHKESNRLDAIVACVRALGGAAEIAPDSITIRPPAAGRGGLQGALLDPSADHRLAMAFAVAGLAIAGVRVAQPGCVTKSYPGFFEELARL